MKLCPCCQRPMPEVRYGVALPSMKARIFDYVLRHRGQDAPAIAEVFYGNSDRVAAKKVHAHINQINGLFAHTNVRISGASKFGYEITGLKSARAA